MRSVLYGPVAIRADLDTRSTITVFELTPQNLLGAAKFQACWFADMAESLQLINIGEIHVVGPEVFQEPFECTLGAPCAVGVQGFRLKRNQNYLGIFKDADCNDASKGDFGSWFENPTIAGFNPEAAMEDPNHPIKSYDDVEFKSGNYAKLRNDSAVMYHYFNISTRGDPGLYSLCWQDSPGKLFMKVGTIFMKGPQLHKNPQFECRLGVPCITKFTMLGIESGKSSVRLSKNGCFRSGLTGHYTTTTTTTTVSVTQPFVLDRSIMHGRDKYFIEKKYADSDVAPPTRMAGSDVGHGLMHP